MNSFCQEFILKDVQFFQKLTTEQKKQDLIVHKHQYIATWLTFLLMYSLIPQLVGIAISVVNFLINIFVVGVSSYILFFTTMPIAIFIFAIDFVVIYRWKRKNETLEEVKDYLTEKFQNLWLLNCQVISFKDWKNIKKRNKELYNYARSEICNHECYVTTYAIANTLQNPEIKILWIAVQCANERYGHAVLLRNGKIYDTNLRRTFNHDEYFKAFNVQIFKEYSLEEYLEKENLHRNSCFSHLEWNLFGKWCKENKVVRST